MMGKGRYAVNDLRRSNDGLHDKIDKLSENVTISLTKQETILDTLVIHSKQIRSLEKSSNWIKGIGVGVITLFGAGATWIRLMVK